MTRVLASLFATAALLAASHAQAESFYTPDIMGGGPNFIQGSSPIPKATVYFNGNYEIGRAHV